MKSLQPNKLDKILQVFAKSAIDGIQVSNITGEIIYMNETACERLGVDKSDTVHVSNFEPLFKQKESWENHVRELRDCDRQVIRSKNINQRNQQEIDVEVTVSIQEIDGEEFIIAVSRDVSKENLRKKKLELRGEMLLAISKATTELLYTNDFFAAVINSLEIIGKAVNVDRTYLFTRNLGDQGEPAVSQRCEWNSGQVEPQINNPELQNVPLSLFDDFLAMMESNTPFQSIVEKLPEESALREILANQGIISILIIPVFHKGEFWGFIGYDECNYERVWDQVELSILQTLSNNMTSTLERLDYNQQIENLAEFPLENPAPVIRIDKKGTLLFHNKMEQIQNNIFRRLNRIESLNFQELLHLISSDLGQDENIKYYEVQAGENNFYSITAKIVERQSHINLYFSDISKLKQTEKQLVETRSIIDQIVNNMEDVIWSVSYPDFNALFISPSTEKLYGVSSKAFYKDSQVWLKPIIEEDKYIIQQIFDSLEKTGESDFEYRITVPDGKVKWLRNRAKLMYDSESNKPVRVDGYIVDITTQKLNQELSEEARRIAEESNLAKEEFISNMSHEIRTPLNAILGLSRQLYENAEDRQLRHGLNNILQSGNHLHSLIENILDFSKITAGQFELNLGQANLTTEILAVYEMLENLAKEKNIEYHQSIDSRLNIFAEIDKRRFRQILINIISNAIKFTDKGMVSIKANLSVCEQKIELLIKDSGIGMTPEFIEKIYDKFAQEDSSHERKSQGAGLGMSITKKIIDLMGGEISIQSSRGIGTEVKLVIPFIPSSKNEVSDQKRSTFLEQLKDKKILVAEDNELNAFVLCNTLNKIGVHSYVVSNGVEAVEFLKNHSMDLILMDLQMPLMGGVIATKIIRQELNLDLPIVGLSANALNSSKSECLRNGMNEYITKPFEEDQLIEALVNLLITPSDQGKVYDLSNYSSKTKEDTIHLKEIAGIFVKLIPDQLAKMKEALLNQDYHAIKQIAHKIKPNLIMFGVEQAKEHIAFLNSFNLNNNTHVDEIEARIKELTEIVFRVCEKLKQDFLD